MQVPGKLGAMRLRQPETSAAVQTGSAASGCASGSRRSLIKSLERRGRLVRPPCHKLARIGIVASCRCLQMPGNEGTPSGPRSLGPAAVATTAPNRVSIVLTIASVSVKRQRCRSLEFSQTTASRVSPRIPLYPLLSGWVAVLSCCALRVSGGPGDRGSSWRLAVGRRASHGLEPRTRGLRVRCSVRFYSSNSYHSAPSRAATCRTVRQATRAGAV